MTKDEHLQYWLDSAQHDLSVAESLYETCHFDYCLYKGHFVLEKVLKAHYVNAHDTVPPKTHDLVNIARLSNLNLSKEDEIFFNKVNDFQIESRYPRYKQEFYKTCTKEYADTNFNKIKEKYLWLISIIK